MRRSPLPVREELGVRFRARVAPRCIICRDPPRSRLLVRTPTAIATNHATGSPFAGEGAGEEVASLADQVRRHLIQQVG